MSKQQRIEALKKQWDTDPRWQEITRDYTAEKVVSLQGSVVLAETLATQGAQKLWDLLQEENYMTGFGAVTGNQAMQQVRAGALFVYISGWQIAADANTAHNMYPDLSLYPVDSGPSLVKGINNALIRADQIQFHEGKEEIDWLVPTIIDAEAGFGGVLNVFELTRNLIKAGISGIHFEDQLPSAKRCGHLGGKVVVSTREVIQKLSAARLAADVAGVPTVLIGRTDAYGAKFINTDHDPIDAPFVTGERSPEGLYALQGGMDHAIVRALAMAPYVDMLWCETGKPNLDEAAAFAKAIHEVYPNKPLVYNCSPSFNWKKYLSEDEIKQFQQSLADLGYRIHLITLAGFHSNNLATFELVHQYQQKGLSAYVDLQTKEFALEAAGYTATKHQHEVGTSYFDAVIEEVTGSEGAMKGATEEAF